MIEEDAASSSLDTATATATSPDDPPLEWLETQICQLAGDLTAATYRFLVLLGDFDARQGWAQWDLPSCAAWLSWKCQLTAGTAREHVRVARALPALPVLSAEFAAGRMSFAKIRALTRIATPATDADLAELAGPMTASQLERFVRAHRHVTRADSLDAAVTRRVTWRQELDGTLAMTVRLPPADGAVVLQALRAAAGDLVHPHADHDHKTQPGTGQEPAGTGQEPAEPAVATPASLADALVDVGRRHRTPPPALRRAVRERDRYRCQFPGCDSRKTDIHHIVHWARHGETKLVNLILLCKAHHVIVHDGGYIITAKPGGFTFTTTSGTTIPASPQLSATDSDIRACHDATITPDTIIPAWHGDRLDLDHAIWACFANATIDQERLAAEAT
jgi:hypothetical protein